MISRPGFIAFTDGIADPTVALPSAITSPATQSHANTSPVLAYTVGTPPVGTWAVIVRSPAA